MMIFLNILRNSYMKGSVQLKITRSVGSLPNLMCSKPAGWLVCPVFLLLQPSIFLFTPKGARLGLRGPFVCPAFCFCSQKNLLLIVMERPIGLQGQSLRPVFIFWDHLLICFPTGSFCSTAFEATSMVLVIVSANKMRAN